MTLRSGDLTKYLTEDMLLALSQRYIYLFINRGAKRVYSFLFFGTWIYYFPRWSLVLRLSQCCFYQTIEYIIICIHQHTSVTYPAVVHGAVGINAFET